MMETWNTLTLDELRGIINGVTFTDCVIVDNELRIGIRGGIIRITLNATQKIKYCEKGKIDYWC